MVTTEELLKHVPPQDVIDELRAISEKSKNKVPFDVVKKLFYHLLGDSAFNSITDIDERCRHASKATYAKINAKMKQSMSGGNKVSVVFTVFERTPMQKFTGRDGKETTTAKVYGAFSGSTEDENSAQYPKKYGVLTFWDAAGAEFAQSLQREKSYTGKFFIKGDRSDANNYLLSGYEGDIESIKEVSLTVPSIADHLEKLISPIINPSEFDFYIGANRLVRCLIQDSKTIITSTGKPMGITNVSDVTGSIDQKTAGVMWFNTPEFASKYAAGTDCYMVVKIQPSKNVQFGATSVSGEFIAPIFEVNINDDDFFKGIFDDEEAPEVPAEPVVPPAPVAPAQTAPAPTQPAPVAPAPAQVADPTPAPEPTQPAPVPASAPAPVPSPDSNSFW
jgi:hypothetical protein